MSWRAKRQIIILLTLLAVLGGTGGFLIWKSLPAPTCTDNKKNQDELDVDCGGAACAPCELKHPKEIEKFWARAVDVGGGKYDAAAEIRNPNEQLSSARVQYEFIFSDEFGEITRRTGEMFLFPQERMHAVETGIPVNRLPERIDFRLTDAAWEYRHEENPNLLAERRTHHIEREGEFLQSVVETSILNRTSKDIREYEVRIVLLDENENLIGANRVLVKEPLQAGARKALRILWPKAFEKNPQTIIVEPRVNVFDKSVFLKP